ncbi:MAG: glycosyltransferase [Chitinivibrionales bacterium]|nr:glycosyltransferase [Chitinivibrionales bacterium]
MAHSSLRIFQLIEHLRIGGAERMFTTLLPELQNIAEIEIFAGVLYEGGELEKYLHRHNIPLYKIRKKKFQPHDTLTRLHRLLRELEIDILHMHEFSAAFWGRIASVLSGVKARLITDHAVAGWHNPAKHKIINRTLLPLTDKIVALSGAAGESLMRVEGIPAQKIISIPNGIDLEPLERPAHRDALRQKYGIASGEVLIGMVGRLSREKGAEVLIKAVHELRKLTSRPFRAIIVGDGDQAGSCKRIAREFDVADAVIFTGSVDHTEIAGLLYSLDIGVVPSHQENCSIALIEQMACGLPVVATDAGGNAELLDNGNCGIIVSRNNPQALAQQIALLMCDAQLRISYGEKAKARSRRYFTVQAMAAAYHRTYRQLLSIP